MKETDKSVFHVFYRETLSKNLSSNSSLTQVTLLLTAKTLISNISPTLKM